MFKELIIRLFFVLNRLFILDTVVTVMKVIRKRPQSGPAANEELVVVYDDARLLSSRIRALCETLPMGEINPQTGLDGNKRILYAVSGLRADSNKALIYAADCDGSVVYLPGRFLRALLDVAGLPNCLKEISNSSIATKSAHISNRGFYSLASNLQDVTFTVSPYIVVFILSLLIMTLFSMGLFEPQDDLPRHLKAFQYQFDYRNLFVYSYHPSYNSYALFDVLASFLFRAMGHNAILFFQLLSFLLTAIALIRMCESEHDNLVSAMILATFYFTWNRFLSGRPCILVSSIFLCANAYKDVWPRWLHGIIGLLMASLYYLFFLYTIPLLFVRRIRLTYVLVTVLGIAAWMFYSSGHFFLDLFSLATTSNVKGLGIGYAELTPLLSFALVPNLAPLVPFIALWKKDRTRSLSVLFFICLNQTRYLETIIPLCVSYLKFTRWKVPAAVVLVLFTLSIRQVTHQKAEVITLPDHSTVLATSSTLMSAVVAGSDRVKIVPSANLGWNEPRIQKGIARIVKSGRFDCSLVEDYGFDYVVESQLTEIPACLTLAKTQGAVRIWKSLGSKAKLAFGAVGLRQDK